MSVIIDRRGSVITQRRSERRAGAEFHPQSQRSTDYHSVSSVTLVTHLQTQSVTLAT